MIQDHFNDMFFGRPYPGGDSQGNHTYHLRFTPEHGDTICGRIIEEVTLLPLGEEVLLSEICIICLTNDSLFAHQHNPVLDERGGLARYRDEASPKHMKDKKGKER